MLRLLFGTLAVFALIVAAGFAALSGPADAQDGIDGRIVDLETRVANGEEEIGGLRRRVQRLEREFLTPQAAQANQSEEAAQPDAGGTVTVSGVGTTLSDKFQLASGRYRVSATLEAGDFSGFICVAHGDVGEEETLFNELIDEPGTWTGSTVLEVGTGGEFFLEVSNTDYPWTVVFEPF